MSLRVLGADNVGTGKATGQFAHAEGSGAATNAQTHAEGSNTLAGGNYSHSEGTLTYAAGQASHAEGSSTNAGGTAAHAEGTSSQAAGTNAHAEGDSASAFRSGQHAKASGKFVTQGDAQYSNFTQFAATTTATPKVLTSGGAAVDSSGGGGTSVLTIPAGVAMIFRVELIARRTDVAGEAAAFSLSGAVARDATGAPRLVGAPTTASWADAAASGWTAAVSVVTVSGTVYYLAVTVTGEAGKTIRWVAGLHVTEVG